MGRNRESEVLRGAGLMSGDNFCALESIRHSPDEFEMFWWNTLAELIKDLRSDKTTHIRTYCGGTADLKKGR
jgi:hypothetical protein